MGGFWSSEVGFGAQNRAMRHSCQASFGSKVEVPRWRQNVCSATRRGLKPWESGRQSLSKPAPLLLFKTAAMLCT